MIHAALDTSKDFALAIEKDGQIILSTHQDGTGRDSDRLLADWLIRAFSECGLAINDANCWSVGIGPGSFAGLRCGIAMIKGLCLSSKALLRGMPSIYALARAADEEMPQARSFGILNDGRCGQVIFSRYVKEPETGKLVLDGDPMPLFAEEVAAPEYACDAWITNQAETLPALPEAIVEKLINVDRLEAKYLLDVEEKFRWPQNVMEREISTTPIYVRQAVFVRPATLRTV